MVILLTERERGAGLEVLFRRNENEFDDNYQIFNLNDDEITKSIYIYLQGNN